MSSAGYAVRGHHYYVDGKRKSNLILMHRVITGAAKGICIDHIDGDPLNNTRENMRHVTHGQNMLNKKLRSDSSSGHKGVQKHGNKWRAHITRSGVRHRLGSFADLQDAIYAYNEAALNIHGDYARLSA